MAPEPPTPRAPVALYVHFPFCLSVCPYCDFVVYAGRAARGQSNQIERFVDALLIEIAIRSQPTSLASVYLGGGTPSLMSARDVGRILGAADASFGIAPGAEVTIEVNPALADRGDLAGFRAAGVNRVSIGAQSFDSAELRTLGRRHSPADIGATVAEARAAGMSSVSLDLLYDVPTQTLDSWRVSLEGALSLQPDHVSAYALTLDVPDPAGPATESDDHLRPSAGATRWRARARREQDEDRAAEMYELADDLLARAGVRWYEISNWSRAGHESRHNLAYWTSEPWEAVGPGAHSFDGGLTRRWNAARLDGYVAALESGRLPPGDKHTNTAAEADAERAILRLRTVAGLPHEMSQRPEFRSAVSWAIGNGLLEENEEGVRLTRRGRLLSNELFSRLLAPAEVAA